MNVHQALVSGVLASLIVSSSPLVGTIAAQSGRTASQGIWENGRLQVRRVSLAPGERVTEEPIGGSVIVFLTADLEGRMPPVEAAWRDPGPVTMENRGPVRFEALVIDLKGSSTRAGGVTPPDVARAVETIAPPSGFDGSYATMIRAQNLIVNDRVSVTKQHYASGVSWSVDPLHFHPQDAVVIYLTGGYTWPTTWLSGPHRVRRGDVRIVPANVRHASGNAGSDPPEFLLIIPA